MRCIWRCAGACWSSRDGKRPRPRAGGAALLLAAVWALALAAAGPAGAAIRIAPGEPLQAALDRAPPRSTVRLAPGVHRGPVVVARPLALVGEPGAVIEGDGRGSVVRVRAPDVRIAGLVIRGGGSDLTALDAAVFVERTAARVRIEGNRIESPAFGIWLDQAPDAVVRGNRIHGDPRRRSQDRGNGVHLYYLEGALVEGNEIWETRDGIYIDNSRRCVLRGNRIRDLRFGIHYMYSHDNRVEGNRTTRTRTGYALMQSRGLTVTGNRSEGDHNYGILLNYITYSRISGNVVRGVRGQRGHATGGAAVAGGEGKALFVYNSTYNEIRGNLFADSDIGVHLTAGSEDNVIVGNAFVGNRIQVKYVASRRQEWSRDGRGNYWSDYLGWDLDGDGIGDRPYWPNDAVDLLLWRYPLARLLMHSPAVRTLRWAQEHFPVLRPPGVRDSHPLMRPPPLPEALS